MTNVAINRITEIGMTRTNLLKFASYIGGMSPNDIHIRRSSYRKGAQLNRFRIDGSLVDASTRCLLSETATRRRLAEVGFIEIRRRPEGGFSFALPWHEMPKTNGIYLARGLLLLASGVTWFSWSTLQTRFSVDLLSGVAADGFQLSVSEVFGLLCPPTSAEIWCGFDGEISVLTAYEVGPEGRSLHRHLHSSGLDWAKCRQACADYARSLKEVA